MDLCKLLFNSNIEINSVSETRLYSIVERNIHRKLLNLFIIRHVLFIQTKYAYRCKNMRFTYFRYYAQTAVKAYSFGFVKKHMTVCRDELSTLPLEKKSIIRVK